MTEEIRRAVRRVQGDEDMSQNVHLTDEQSVFDHFFKLPLGPLFSEAATWTILQKTTVIVLKIFYRCRDAMRAKFRDGR